MTYQRKYGMLFTFSVPGGTIKFYDQYITKFCF